MKRFIRLLAVFSVSAALVGCSAYGVTFTGRSPHAEYPDTVASGHSALELLDMSNGSQALTYKLQTGRPNDPAYAEMRRRAFEDPRAIEVQVIGGALRSAATCTAFNIGVEMITSQQQTAAPREVVRQAGYDALNVSNNWGLTNSPPGYYYRFPIECLNTAQSKVPPPPGGWATPRY